MSWLLDSQENVSLLKREKSGCHPKSVTEFTRLLTIHVLGGVLGVFGFVKTLMIEKGEQDSPFISVPSCPKSGMQFGYLHNTSVFVARPPHLSSKLT